MNWHAYSILIRPFHPRCIRRTVWIGRPQYFSDYLVHSLYPWKSVDKFFARNVPKGGSRISHLPHFHVLLLTYNPYNFQMYWLTRPRLLLVQNAKLNLFSMLWQSIESVRGFFHKGDGCADSEKVKQPEWFRCHTPRTKEINYPWLCINYHY